MKHPESWNAPCELPRDKDCGEYIDCKYITQVNHGLKTVSWKINGQEYWATFNEIWLKRKTKILDQKYINNMELV